MFIAFFKFHLFVYNHVRTHLYGFKYAYLIYTQLYGFK